MTPAQIERFFAILQAANPHPETELEYGSAFELLVAVLLSAQATDAGVNKATRILFPLARTPQQSGHQNHWPVSQQGPPPAANLPHPRG